jgi:hypothetical protein
MGRKTVTDDLCDQLRFFTGIFERITAKIYCSVHDDGSSEEQKQCGCKNEKLPTRIQSAS